MLVLVDASAFAQARGADADQPRFTLQRGDVRAAAVAHAGAQPAGQLVDHRRDAALVGDPSFDAFRHQLLAGFGVGIEVEFVLEVAIAAAAAHRAERAHAAILLEAAALIQDQFARALVGAGEQAADHHRAGADRHRFGQVAGVADPAVGDDRDLVP